MDRIEMFKPYVNEAAIELVCETLRSGWIGEGPRVHELETKLRDKFNFSYVTALNSGTAGLRLALALCDVGPGDEVITTAQTCSATNTAILEQFATPVFADIQYWTGNINPADIEHRITERTKAIIVVHWAGYPCDLDEINDIGKAYGIPVIEDAAHALGATYRGKFIGAGTSDFAMFSLQAIKHLTTADGGLLTMQTEEKYDEARRRRWFGIDRRKRRRRKDGYWFWNQTEVGYKMQMSDVAASIGLGNLIDLDKIIERRHEIVSVYLENLTSVPGVHVFTREPDRESGDWLFTMHVEKRPKFCDAMRARGVDVSVVHIRNDAHDIFGGRRNDLPVLDEYEKTQISIPLHNHLTDEDVEHVVASIKRGW